MEDMPAYRAYPKAYQRSVYDRRVAAGVPEPMALFDGGQRLEIAGRSVEVVSSPGHTMGHVSYFSQTRIGFFW